MSRHRELVSDRSKWVRRDFDDKENCIRILLLDNVYDKLKPLYDYYVWIASGVTYSITDIPEYIQASFDWLSNLVFEYGVGGITFTVSVLIWVKYWARNRINLGKFTYKYVGRLGERRLGSTRLGGGAILLELPVEG